MSTIRRATRRRTSWSRTYRYFHDLKGRAPTPGGAGPAIDATFGQSDTVFERCGFYLEEDAEEIP